MDPITLHSRKQELQTLLAEIRASPSRAWNRERQRVMVLQQMVAGEANRLSPDLVHGI